MSLTGEVCGVCGAGLRTAARFCGRCGAEQGTLVPREVGAGRAVVEPARARRAAIGPRGLGIALGMYFAMLVPQLWLVQRQVVDLDIVLGLEGFILAVGLVGLGLIGRPGWALVRPRAWPPRWLAVHLVATLALAGAVIGLGRALPELFLDDAALFPGLGVALLYGAAVPAVAEEVAFRGGVMASLEGIFTPRTAAIVTALLFAALHLSPMSAFHLAGLGLITAHVRWTTGSVWPCVAIHALYNAVVLAPAYL